MALTVPVVDDELPDYGPLVVGSLNAAGVVLGGNAVVTVLTANLLSVTTEIRFLWSAVPYVALVAEPDRFVTVTTLAAASGAAALAAWLVVSARRTSLAPLQRAGRLSALPMAASLLAIQVSRLAAADVSALAAPWLLASVVLLVAAGAVAVRAVQRSFVSPDRETHETSQPTALTRSVAVDDLPDAASPATAVPTAGRPVTTSGFRRNLRSNPANQEASR